MMLWAVYAGIAILAVFKSNRTEGTFAALCGAVFNTHYFLVLYTLFARFRDEENARVQRVSNQEKGRPI